MNLKNKQPILNATEQRALARAFDICDQLAYHLRGSDLGDDAAIVVSKLETMLKDTELAPCGVETNDTGSSS
jgi:hypothetical protein